MFGHFLSPDSDDLLVGAYGCEPHVWTGRGSVVFSRRSGVWSISRKYHSGIVGHCRKIRNRSGLDGLLCIVEDRYFTTSVGSLYFYYADKNEDSLDQELLQLYDNLDEACFAPYGPGNLDKGKHRQTPLLEAKIASLRLSPLTHGRTFPSGASHFFAALPNRV
jgi:hypothetical protein